MNIKQSMKISAIVDKMQLKINNPKATQDEIGADLIMQVLSKAHNADKEIINFIADFKKISAEEAEEVDLFKFIKELGEVSGLKDFFTYALK